ncbi:M48 family metalloprotease [Schlegelella sp. S2-27]|uniref:M48 family metalloprotease n=1 Tax=Caldimonas mangrovi TaxID=2944811 RepID=A0ABT0YQR1_9BURK|nr:M48 family metalloprotease [Caldimonas mangrovi]MCM5681071.1 M48 family metalloprotease [Caldimonas mangrovi]
MNPSLVYKHEGKLSTICLVLSLIVWLALVVGTLGIALIYLLFGFLGYLFVHSAFISYLKGTGVKLTPEQFPDLHQRFVECCRKLGVEQPPEAYVLHGDGMFNAFATRFLGRHFVILLSDVVDAFEHQPEALDFYIGHELGHIRRGHLTGMIWRAPASVLPLLGAAYSRAREYTCDLHGLACCPQPEHAARALAAISAGGKRWADVNLRQLANQSQQSGGFWMSFHELTGDYPWLVKRLARVIDGDNAQFPRRHGFAWFLACFTPRVGGRGSGAVGLVLMVAIVGILAAVAIPAYHDYQQRAQVAIAYQYGAQAAALVEGYYRQNEEVPETLEQAGFTEGALPPGVTGIEYTADGAVITLVLADDHRLALVPSSQDDGSIRWACESDDIPGKHLPKACSEGQ